MSGDLDTFEMPSTKLKICLRYQLNSASVMPQMDWMYTILQELTNNPLTLRVKGSRTERKK